MSDLNDGLKGPMIKMDFPITTLLKCEGHLFVCVGETNDITFDSHHVDSLSMDLLSEPSAFASFQILHLIPAMVDDSTDLKHNWKWSLSRGTSHQVQGHLIEAINPDILTQHIRKPANNIPQVK